MPDIIINGQAVFNQKRDSAPANAEPKSPLISDSMPSLIQR